MVLPDVFKGDDSDGGDNFKITINKKYAEKYQKFKECQELDKLKRKYENDEEDDSSTSESEDEDAQELTPQIEQDFLKTLSMIKQKDPKIYKKDSVFFTAKSDEGNSDKMPVDRKDKQPILLRDYERQRLLEKGGKAYLSDDSDEETANEEIQKLKNQNGATYVEEQEEIKKTLISAAHSDSEDNEDLLQIREKEVDEKEAKVEDNLSIIKSKTNALDRYWHSTQLGDDDKFLRDYILNKQYIDVESSRIPSYKEIIANLENEDFSDSETEREQFERKFNFRYEEPDSDFIKRYPRTISESVRRKDDRRKQQRKQREERKQKEKEKKKDELKRLKNLKRKEILGKIEKLKEITGNKKVGFLEEDMQGEFDLSKYDELMEKVFDDEYYNDESIVDEEKPVFSEDEGEEYFEDYENYDNCDNYEGEEYTPHCEDPGFVMDADYVEGKTKKDKKLSMKKGFNAKFAEAVKREKPLFDPSQQTFQEYFDEYYKLDFEDIIDDMPIRFKYREVVPNDFGLTTDEILKAEDKELNEWCSLRKTMQYVGDDEEKKRQQKFKKKARSKNKKLQVFTSLREEFEKESADSRNTDNPNLEQIVKPRNIKQIQKKKEKLNKLDVQSKPLVKKRALMPSWNHQSRRSIVSSVNKTKVKNIRKNFKGGNNKLIKKLSLERLAAYGLDERKKKSI